jgi:hypothetical protein
MTDRQDPAQDSLTEVTDKVLPHREAVATAEQGWQHFERFCGYACSAEPGHREAMNARQAEANADNEKWRSTFDENGRYLDPVTGFWESLNAEFYVADTQKWASAQIEYEVGPVSGTRYPQRATLAAAQIKITNIDYVPLVEFRALPRDNVFPGHAEVVKLIETRVGPTNSINYDEQIGLGAYIVDGAETPTVGTILTLHHGETGMPVEQYWDQLNAHDWHYCFADAGMDAYMSGEANEDRLKAIAEQGGDDYEALYQAFRKHHNTGEPWRNAQWDKPHRPVNGVVVIPEAPADKHAVEATHKSNGYPCGNYPALGDGTAEQQHPPAINAEQAARIAPKTKAERWVTNFVLGIAALALAMLVSGMWINLALFEWAGLDRLHQIRDGSILLVIAFMLNLATGRVAERNDKPA